MVAAVAPAPPEQKAPAATHRVAVVIEEAQGAEVDVVVDEVAAVVALVLPEQKAPAAVRVVIEGEAEVAAEASHQVVVGVVIKEEGAEVGALGHQVWGLLETQYSEVLHLLISASRPPAR